MAYIAYRFNTFGQKETTIGTKLNYKREGNDVSTTTSFPFCSLNTLSNIEKVILQDIRNSQKEFGINT